MDINSIEVINEEAQKYFLENRDMISNLHKTYKSIVSTGFGILDEDIDLIFTDNCRQ